MPNATPREEIAYVGPRKANVQLEIRAHSSVTQTRKANERVVFVHLFPETHCSENSKGDGKGGHDGGAEGTPKLTRESLAGKANRLPSLNFRKGSCQKGYSCNCWLFVGCAKFKTAGCMVGEKCAQKHTAKYADAKNSSATIAIHIPADDERQMQIIKYSRMKRHNYE